MKYISPHIIRQIFVLLLIVLMGTLIFQELLPYLSGILGTIRLYVILQKPMKFLVSKGWNINVSAIVLLVSSFICLLLPIVGLELMIGSKIEHAVANSQKIIDAAKQQLETIESHINIDISSNIDTSSITTWLSNSLQNFAGGTFTMSLSIFIMYFLLFFALTNIKSLRAA